MKRGWLAAMAVAVGLVLTGLDPVLTDDPVDAAAAVVMEARTGRVLYEQNAHEPLPMASTTKIMTTLLTLEQPDLEEPFVVDEEAIQVEGSSMGLQVGDTVTLLDLAYGMMLPSGHDAANAAAVRIAGSQRAFAALMNQRARQLGMEDTFFVNPSGLDAQGHEASAYDLALLQRAALRDGLYREISGQTQAKRSFGNPPYDRWLSNHNKLLTYYEWCISGKTGYTDAARRCLVTAAEKDGITLICVTLNCPDDWQVHQTLYEECFARLEGVDARELAGEYVLPVMGGEEAAVTVSPAVEESAFRAAAGERDRLEQRIHLPAFVYAPVARGEVLGKAVYSLDGEELARVALVAEEAVPAQEPAEAGGLWSRLRSLLPGGTS